MYIFLQFISDVFFIMQRDHGECSGVCEVPALLPDQTPESGRQCAGRRSGPGHPERGSDHQCKVTGVTHRNKYLNNNCMCFFVKIINEILSCIDM